MSILWQLVLRIVKASPFIHQPDRVMCKQLVGYINTREKIRYFFTCVVTACLRAGKSLYNTAVYVINLYPLFFTLYIVCYWKDQINKAFNSSIRFSLCHSHLIADAFVINASTDSNRKNVFETKSAEVSNNKRTNMSYCITFLIHIACWILCGSDHDKPS